MAASRADRGGVWAPVPADSDDALRSRWSQSQSWSRSWSGCVSWQPDADADAPPFTGSAGTNDDEEDVVVCSASSSSTLREEKALSSALAKYSVCLAVDAVAGVSSIASSSSLSPSMGCSRRLVGVESSVSSRGCVEMGDTSPAPIISVSYLGRAWRALVVLLVPSCSCSPWTLLLAPPSAPIDNVAFHPSGRAGAIIGLMSPPRFIEESTCSRGRRLLSSALARPAKSTGPSTGEMSASVVTVGIGSWFNTGGWSSSS